MIAYAGRLAAFFLAVGCADAFKPPRRHVAVAGGRVGGGAGRYIALPATRYGRAGCADNIDLLSRYPAPHSFRRLTCEYTVYPPFYAINNRDNMHYVNLQSGYAFYIPYILLLSTYTPPG